MPARPAPAALPFHRAPTQPTDPDEEQPPHPSEPPIPEPGQPV